MKAQDREAIKTVEKSAAQKFAQRCFYLQSQERAKWTHFWRAVRLICGVCGEGYLVRKRQGKSAGVAECVQCAENGPIPQSEPMPGKVFWQTKATIVMHLVTGEDTGQLWPYILVEIQDRVVQPVGS